MKYLKSVIKNNHQANIQEFISKYNCNSNTIRNEIQAIENQNLEKK
jgi:hypothetical protein